MNLLAFRLLCNTIAMSPLPLTKPTSAASSPQLTRLGAVHVAALALAAAVSTQVVIALLLLGKVDVPLARLQQQVQQILLRGVEVRAAGTRYGWQARET